jgi:hypothetical protein
MPRWLLVHLQLIRPPNVVTAAADSLAGWLLVGGALRETDTWLPLAVASMVLYASGIALNDAFDADLDRIERPGRPIPSGRVSRSFAFRLGGLGLAAGPLVAWLSGSAASLAIAALLAAVILAYNAGLKQTRLGPLLMGGCRGLNLLLGMTHAERLGGPAAWVAATSFALFVTGLTWISRSETETGEIRNLLAGLSLQNLAILGLLAAAFKPRAFPNPPPETPLLPLEGPLLLGLVALAVNVAATRAIHHPTPPHLQRTVTTGILALVWIDVALVASVRGVGPALAVATLWIPAYLLGRIFYRT